VVVANKNLESGVYTQDFENVNECDLLLLLQLGVIIHENRFTYEQKGLQKVMDLGEYLKKPYLYF
jgi:predicted solute-binding protein